MKYSAGTTFVEFAKTLKTFFQTLFWGLPCGGFAEVAMISVQRPEMAVVVLPGNTFPNLVCLYKHTYCT